MLDLRAVYVYLGIFLALIAAGVGFPIPEELPILTGGAMVGHAADETPPPGEFLLTLAVAPDAAWPAGIPWAALVTSEQYVAPRRIVLRWWIMLPVCIFGVVLSDGLLYGMGRFWGPRLFEKRWMKKMLPDDKRKNIEENFHKYGIWVLLFARFLPAIRSPIFIMAGVMRLSFTKFLLADGIYAIPGVSLLFTLAFWFGDQVRDLILRAEGKLKTVIILLVLSAIGGYLLYHFFRHPVATGDPSKDVPLVGEQIAAKIEKMTHADVRLDDGQAAKEAPARQPEKTQ